MLKVPPHVALRWNESAGVLARRPLRKRTIEM